MKNLIFIFLLFILTNSAAIGQENDVVFKSNPSESYAYTTKDEYGTIHYHTDSTSFHYLRFPSYELTEEFPYEIVLVKQEKTESIFLGSEGYLSLFKLTAWEAKTDGIGKKLYEIEQNGQRCEFKEKTIEITLFGCCDSPTKTYVYDIKTGILLK